ncbi:FAD-dependent oxidoreductase [Peribacillus sp. NPDC060186]
MRSTLYFPSFSNLEKYITTDVLIVGGGITGITSAYLLVKQSVKVPLIQAGEILNGKQARQPQKSLLSTA